MNEQAMQEITRKVAAEIRDSATKNETTATELHDEATRLRAKAAELRVQADGFETSAVCADANAATYEAAAEIKRQQAAAMEGRPELPTPGTIVPVEGLGLAIGALRMVPREDASPEELTSFRDLMQAVHEQALHQLELVRGRLRDAQATVTTGQIPAELLPQPDPLTASPAEDSGGHAIPPYAEHIGHRVEITTSADERITAKVIDVNTEHLFYDVGPGADPVRFLPLEQVTAVRSASVSLAGRPFTPDRTEIGEDGREHTVITGKRSCNGCGLVLGDVTEAEVLAVVESGGLPDVRGECPSCSKPDGGAAVSEAEERCEYCTTPIVLLDGAWLHAEGLEAECGPDGGQTATPMHVHPGMPDEPEPGHTPEPLTEPKKSTALQGIARVAGGFPRPRRHKAPGSGRPSPYAEHVGRNVIVTTSTLRMGGRLEDVTATALLFRVRVGGSFAEPEEIPLEQVERVEATPAQPAPVEAAPRDTAPDGQVPALAAPVEPQGYPDEPTVPAAPVDPAQARLDDLAMQMREDRLPFADADTEAFARVPGDGDAR